MEIKKIETYSLYEFCQAVEQAVVDGWRFDFNSNDLFPTMFGSMLVTGMVKVNKSEDKPEVILQDNNSDNLDNTENKSEVKRGRKPKDNT
jgi:hypothetical protein